MCLHGEFTAREPKGREECGTQVISEHVRFPNALGQLLSGRIDRPVDKPSGWALFAHCFTCTKNLKAASHLAQALARAGVGVLRFDFTGLGNSQGEFAATTFSHNVDDLVAAAGYLEATHGSLQLLVGHSLGGTAALHAAARLEGVRAVATVAAPSHAVHLTGLLRSSLAEIEATGEAEVDLGGGRRFRVRREFLEDLRRQDTLELVRKSQAALLVLHSPLDTTVDISNAAEIFGAARHPKSFVSLDRADHLLSQERDAIYAGRLIAIWAERYTQVQAQCGPAW